MDNPKLTQLFDSIADEIRNKRGTTAEIKAANFPEEIALIDTDPSAGTTASASDLLEGKTAYSNKTKLTGTMPNNGKITEVLDTQGEQYTIPKGYHDGTGTVTAQLGVATITANVNASISNPSYNSDKGGFDITATATSLEPTINTDGYISTKLGTKKSTTDTNTKTLSKIEIGSTVSTSGSLKVTPIVKRTKKSDTNNWVDASNDLSATTTTPTDGKPYVRIDTDAKDSTVRITPTSKVISDGYGTTSQFTKTDTTKDISVGANASSATYVPIKEGGVSLSKRTITKTEGYISGGTVVIPSGTIKSGDISFSNGNPTLNSDGKYDITVTAISMAPTYSEGYVDADSIRNGNENSTNITLDKVELGVSGGGTFTATNVTPNISVDTTATTTYTNALDTNGTITETAPKSGAYIKVNSTSASSSKTVTVTPTVTKEGYGKTTSDSYATTSSNVTVNYGANSSNAKYIPIKKGSISQNGSSIDVTEGWITGSDSLSIPTATITSGAIEIKKNSISYNSTDSEFKINVTATSGEPSINKAGYVSSSTTKNGNKETTDLSLGKISISSSVTTSGTSTYQPTINVGTKGSSETFTNAYSGTIVRGTTPNSTDPYIKVSSASNTGDVNITATPKVDKEGYGTDSNSTKTNGTGSITVGASASQDTYIPIKKGTLTVTKNEIAVTEGWLSSNASTSISGATITSGSGIPSVTTPTYNSTSKDFKQTVSTGTISVPTVDNPGYISSDIGIRNTSSAKTTTNSLPVITIDNIIPTLTRKPTIEKVSKSDSETWIDASNGNASSDSPSAGTPYVKVQTNPVTESISITPTVTSRGYSDGTYFNKAKSSYSATTGAMASDAYYVPITVGSASIKNTGAIPVDKIDVTYSSGKINVSASGSKDYIIDFEEGYITSADGASISASGNTSKAIKELDSNLKAENIRSGATIFDISGTYVCPTDTENPASASHILEGKIAYQGNKKITGTMADNGAKNYTITSQSGSYTIPAGYHNGSGKVTATINKATLTAQKSSVTLSDPTLNSDSTKFAITASGTSLPPTVTKAGYISSNTAIGNGSISGSKDLNKIVISASGSSVTLSPSLGVENSSSSSTWKSANDGTTTLTSTPSDSRRYVKVNLGSASKAVAITPSVKTDGYGTTTAFGISGVSNGSAKVDAKSIYVPIISGTLTNSISLGSSSVTSSMTTNGDTISGCTNAFDSSKGQTDSAPSSGVYVKVTNTHSTNSVTADATAYPSKAGWLETTNTSNATQKSISISNASALYIPIKTGTAKSGAGTITFISNPTLNSGVFKITASGTVAAPTISAGWITSGSSNTITSKDKNLNVIKLDASASGDGTITPTFNKGSKGSSESWIDAMDTTTSKTIVYSAPTTSSPYVKVSMTGGSSIITATPSVNTAGYGNTASGGCTVGTKGTKTVSVSNKDLYIPIKTTSLTAGTLNLNPNGTSTSVPTASGNNYVFTATASVTNASVGEGYVTQESKGADSESITFSMPKAAITASGASISIDPTIVSNTSAISGCTNASESATLVSSVTSGKVYVPVIVSGSNSGNGSYYVSIAGYTPTTSAMNVSSSASIMDTTKYIPIKTTSVKLPSSISKKPNKPEVSFDTATGKFTAYATNSGTCTVTTSLNGNATGWVSSAPSGDVSISGTSEHTTYSIEAATLSGTEITTNGDSVTISAGYLSSKRTITANIPIIDLLTSSNTFTQQNNFSYPSTVTNSSTTTDGTINITSGGLVASSGIKGAKVYNAVWNDLADLIPINEECDLEYGKCYCFDGEKYYKSSKYLDDGIIGIHSDTAGFEMGHKDNTKELKCSVAGFVLAYVDKDYPVGTLLTCTENGYLTEIKKEDKINYPEKIVGSYWKNETEEYWGSETKKVLVNGRKWIKVR